MANDYAGNTRVSGLKVDIGAYEVSKAEWVSDFDDEKYKMVMFPNPAISTMHVQLPFAHSTIRIADIQGKVVLEKAIDNDYLQIEISNWNQGVYMIQCMSEGKVSMGKFIVRH